MTCVLTTLMKCVVSSPYCRRRLNTPLAWCFSLTDYMKAIKQILIEFQHVFPFRASYFQTKTSRFFHQHSEHLSRKHKTLFRLFIYFVFYVPQLMK